MTKKQKRIVMYLAAFLVALALVSICLVGNTFARFVTKGDGSSTVNVSVWKTGGTFSMDATKLSPLNVDYDNSTYTTSNPRSNSTTATHVMTITNDSDVTAIAQNFTVSINTITVANVTYTYGGSSGSYSTGTTIYGDTYIATAVAANSGTLVDNNSYTFSDVLNLFSLTLYSDAGSTAIESTTTLTLDVGNQTQQTQAIYAKLTWTTADATYSGSDTTGRTADALDTFVGENVTAITYSITWNVVQGTKLPA